MQILKVPYLIPFEMTKAFSGFFRKTRKPIKYSGPCRSKRDITVTRRLYITVCYNSNVMQITYNIYFCSHCKVRT